ncbi:MAG: YifB family Mg chelatase-like AAA ATPase [Gammaproteobacteria bacterium]
MKIAILYSRAAVGIQAPLVTIEVHLSNGLPGMSIVGLPEAAVRESKDRVRSAILNNHFEFPLERITINLAPADLPKEGGRFDLAIALGILAASHQIPAEILNHHEFIGELALTGELRPIRGILPVACAAKQAGRTLILPTANADEASLVNDAGILAADHLMAVCAHFTGVQPLPVVEALPVHSQPLQDKDLADVRAQQHAKRALEIAAAGGHNLIMIGPPGTGKTMLAERLPGILPPMTAEQALESAAVASISTSGFHPSRWKHRPFRSPHHTASGVALVGGGSHPRPGEISLAHHGVLFLDELPEFDRRVLEVLREPLESGRIIISRAAHQAEFPAQFQLVAAMNPCPCGYLGDGNGRCRCTADQVQRYRQRISGPLLDRIDLHIEVPNVPQQLLLGKPRPPCEGSREVQARIIAAHEKQLGRAGKTNHKLNNREVDNFCVLEDAGNRLLDQAIQRLGLSARAMHRILKVARTIADLADADHIDPTHLGEAISYRRLDRAPC